MLSKLFDKIVMCKALPSDGPPKPGLRPTGKEAAADPDGPPPVPDAAEGGCWLQHRFELELPSGGGLPSSPGPSSLLLLLSSLDGLPPPPSPWVRNRSSNACGS